MATWTLNGEYLKNCNCLASCPCDTIGTPAPNSYCEGLVGMHIREGHFDAIDLGGLKYAAAFHFPGAMHEGNGEHIIYIDQTASPPQRNALEQILTGKAGGVLFEIIATVIPNLKGIYYVPIEWQFDMAKRVARISVPGYGETTTAPLMIIPTGEEQRVIVRMPNGFEYKEMEVAQAVTLKSTGGIEFDWKRTHSSLAHVVRTDKGLLA
jgi:hypothetical protein